MGATASSAQRDSRCEEDAAEEELAAAASDAQNDGSADDKLLQKNGHISSLNVKTRNHADELNGNFEERVLADVGSGFVTLKEDGTETFEDLQEMDALQPVIKNESTEMVNADSGTVNEEPVEENQVNDINEVGFKKIFRFVGFRFTLKKDTSEKTESNEQEEKVRSASEDSSDTQENSAVKANENTPDETQKSEVSSQPNAAEPSDQTDNERELDQDIKTVEHHVEDTPEKELEKEASPEPEEPMSPIKQFFTQGIFASLRKKKKEEEIQKESKEEELKIIERMDVEEAEKEDSKCMCLDIPYITSEEEKDSQEKDNEKLLPEGELQNSLEKDKVQGSPLKRLFRKFSTRRQRESKAAEKVTEAEEQVSEQPKPSSELIEFAKVEEPGVGEPKPAEEDLVSDVSPQESKKKSDTTVSWEALICGGSAKKRARKTNEDETPDKEEEYEKTTDSPLGSSIEGDYEHLTSSNEQSGSPAEGEMGSTWKTFKKMVTPKRKVRTGESSTPEQIPSDSEMNKDESFSMKKLISGHKKKKSDAKKDQTSSDEAAKDQETGDEDDETPAIIPLSEYEIIEPESLKEVHEQQVEITIEHEMPAMSSQLLEQDTSNNLVPKTAVNVPINTGPAVIHGLSEDFEELTDFVSKHQQLSDIPEEGIIEESIETPVSSAEWRTQDDTLAEDIVELTADAVTAPEALSEQFIGDDTTEMVSAVSQLTDSPRSSGHVTPVSAEYGIHTSDVILQEAFQSIGMTPSVQSVTTKNESQESLAVSFSPYVVQSSTKEETKVLVAHKKTEATAICTGLESQEMESVEEHLPAPLVEAIPEVSDAVPTELVSDNFTKETEIAGLGKDEVYEAEIKELKTEYQDIIVSKKKSAIETELSVDQVIHLVAESLVGESEDTHMEEQREKCTTGIELKQVIETMQSEAGLEQAMSDYSHGLETECPLHSVLDEPVYEQPVAPEPEKELTISDVQLSIAEFDQPASTEVAESLTHGDIDSSPGTTTSKEVKDIEINASIVECLEMTETDSIISPISDCIQTETLELEGSSKLEAVESIHVDACEIQVDLKDAVLLSGDSGVTVQDISGKMEQEKAQQDIKEVNVEEETRDDVASEGVKKIEVENISEPGEESLARERLKTKEVSFPEPVLVEEAEELHKDVEKYLDDKVEDSATDITDGIFVKEDEQDAVKEGQPLTNTDNNETSTDESPDIMVDTGSGIGDMHYKIRERTVVPAFSKDVSELTDTPEEPNASSEELLKPLEIVLPEVEAKSEATEIVVSQTEDWGPDTKPSPELPEENAQPATTENIKTGKVLEMVAIIENTTKQSGKEKSMVSEPVTQVLAKSKLPKATEQEGEAIDGDQVPAMMLSEMKETAVPEEKETVVMVAAPKTEPEGFDSGPTMIEVPSITVLAQNYTSAEIEVGNMSEMKSEDDENAILKCEHLEQVTEKILSYELQVDKTEIKDEIPAVMEITHIAQESPLTSEITAKIPEVAVSEMQSQLMSELRAETLEVTEPKVEIPVVSEVKVETAVVTELVVETPVVTSVVKELEVETPVVTSMAKTTDSHNSAATSHNQNIHSDTLMLTTVIKEQVVEIPTVISVVVTPATPSDEVTPLVTLGNESKDVPPVKDTPVETPNVESVIVRTAVAPVVEIQNVIPVVATPDLGSVIVTEATSPVVSTGTVTTILAEAPVVSTVVETPVFSVTAVRLTPALVETALVESPPVAVGETPVVTQVVQTPGQVSVMVMETVPPGVASEETAGVETDVEVPVLETPVLNSAPVALDETPVVTQVVQVSVMVKETATPVDVSAVAAEVETPVFIPVVETPIVKSTPVAVVEAPVVETPGKVSVMVTEPASPVAVSVVTAAVEAPVEIPVVETPVVKSTPAAVVETPVVQTPGNVSVMVTEAASPVAVSVVTAAVEAPVVIPLVETPVVKSTPAAVVETPVVTPVVQTPDQVSEMVTDTTPSVAVSAVTATVETPVKIPVVETPVVKSTAVAMVETPALTPVVQTLGQVSDMVTETAPPVVVSRVDATVETPVLNPVVESPVVKSTPVAVVETPVLTPVAQTPGQVLVAVTEATPSVVVSAETAAAETPVVIPVAETPIEKSTPVVVVESPVVIPVLQTPGQVVEMVTDTTPSVSPVTATVETPVKIPVVEAPVVKSTAVVVVGTPALTPVVQTPGQVSEMVTDTTPPVVVSVVTAAVETPVATPEVETPIVKSTPVAVVEKPVVTPVVQTPDQVSEIITDTTPPVAVSGVTATVETPVKIPVVEVPVVKLAPIAVIETPPVTPVVQTPRQVSERVTDAVPPVVVSVLTAAVETPVVIPVVETPIVKSTSAAVVETPVVTPVVQTSGQVSEMVTDTKPSVAVSPVTATVETPVKIPVVEAPVVKTTAVAMVGTPALTPEVQTPGQVSDIVTETAPQVVVSRVDATVETSVLNPVVECPVVKSTPVAVVEAPVFTPVAQTPGQVLVAVRDATPPVVDSAETAAAETPVVIPVVEAPTPVVVAETPVVTPVMMTPTVTTTAERSVVSLVLETTTEAPTAGAMGERPVMIPVVQTPALVSVIAKETAPPVVLPAVTVGVEVKPLVVETPISIPEAPAVIPAVQTPVTEQVAQIPTIPAVTLVKATSVVTEMEAPTMTTVEKAQQQTPVAEKPALSPVMMAPANAAVVVATAPPKATSEEKKGMLQVAEQAKEEANSEASLASKDVEPKKEKECISDEEKEKAFLQHTTTEPQSEVEDDVWEDAVDNIGDSLHVTHTEGAPQDTAAKQTSDAAV